MAHSPLNRSRLLAMIVGAVVVLVALIGAGIYGLARGPGQPDHSTHADHDALPGQTPASSESVVRPMHTQEVSVLPKTTDPVAYARAVAEAVFTWDTGSGLRPADYASVVIAGADPSGYETNGLVADLTGYLPTDQTWQQLRDYRTAQSLTIHDAYVPDVWAGIVASAGDQLAAGTIAVTIDGTRHRTGTWFGDTETSTHDVTFTVFVGCPPMFDRCHVLRLSRLDDPLT